MTVSRQAVGDRHFGICRFDPALGEATFPATLLQMLPAGSGFIWIEAATEIIIEVEGWTLMLVGNTELVNTDQKRVDMDAEFL